jgi:hypothetical protein
VISWKNNKWLVVFFFSKFSSKFFLNRHWHKQTGLFVILMAFSKYIYFVSLRHTTCAHKNTSGGFKHIFVLFNPLSFSLTFRGWSSVCNERRRILTTAMLAVVNLLYHMLFSYLISAHSAPPTVRPTQDFRKLPNPKNSPWRWRLQGLPKIWTIPSIRTDHSWNRGYIYFCKFLPI